MVDLNKIIVQALEKDASDIHLMAETKPIYRIGNALVKMEEATALNNEDMYEIHNYFTKGNVAKNKILDTKYDYNGIDLGINLSYSNNVPVYTMKIMKNSLPSYEELRIPDIIRKMTNQSQGLILVTGTKKSGKTTTLNALVRHINETQNKKIITLERKTEYSHKSRNSIIVQKQVGTGKDCLTYYDGVKNALNEDCDVLVVEEISDKATMEAVLEVAESGRLVIASLHTKSCDGTIDKILNFYDEKDRAQIKYALSTLLKLIISQKLIVNTKGNLELVSEVMVGTKSSNNGSISLVESLANLYVDNKITLKQAKSLLEDKDRELLHKTIMKMRITNK